MAHVKNARGGPGDGDSRPPPGLPSDVKGKATKKITLKKQKYADADTARAAAVAVAATAELVERGGARSGVQIADQFSPAQRAAIEQVEPCHGSPVGTIMLEGRCVMIVGHDQDNLQQGSGDKRVTC